MDAWSEALDRLARERALAESGVGLLRAHGRDEAPLTEATGVARRTAARIERTAYSGGVRKLTRPGKAVCEPVQAVPAQHC